MSKSNVIDLADRRPRASVDETPGLSDERITNLALQAVHLPNTLSKSEIELLGAAILAHAGLRRDVV